MSQFPLILRKFQDVTTSQTEDDPSLLPTRPLGKKESSSMCPVQLHPSPPRFRIRTCPNCPACPADNVPTTRRTAIRSRPLRTPPYDFQPARDASENGNRGLSRRGPHARPLGGGLVQTCPADRAAQIVPMSS